MSSPIVKNIAKLLSANVFAQVVGLLIYPILTRLYLPDDFGLLNLFMTIGGVAVLFANAEYYNAIVLPQSDKCAVACCQVCFFITLIVSILFLIATPFASGISEFFNVPRLSKCFAFLPIYIFVMSLWTILNNWYTRNKQFSLSSIYQITQSSLGAGFKWSLFYFLHSFGLVIGTILAPLLAIIINISIKFKTIIKPLLSVDKAECKLVLHKYSNFPKYSLPRAIINYISSSLPILILAPSFSLKEVGYYGMALTLAFTPISLIVRSVYQVFFQNTSEQVQNQVSIKYFFKKYLIRTLLFVAPCLFGLYFILPSLVELILGAGWNDTGTYIQYMLPWLLMMVMVGPISYLSDIFQKQKIGLFLEILLIVSRIIGLSIGIYLNDFSIAILYYCAGSAIMILIQLFWYISLINNYERTLSE